MKILDWYILKKYLSTFITIQLLFIPIAIIVNLADNIDKILDKTYNLEIELKSNSLINKNILMKKLIVDICALANS